jgi:hypothetical protein
LTKKERLKFKTLFPDWNDEVFEVIKKSHPDIQIRRGQQDKYYQLHAYKFTRDMENFELISKRSLLAELGRFAVDFMGKEHLIRCSKCLHSGEASEFSN